MILPFYKEKKYSGLKPVNCPWKRLWILFTFYLTSESWCFSCILVLIFSHQLSHRATSSIFSCSLFFLKPPHTSIPCSLRPTPILFFCTVPHLSIGDAISLTLHLPHALPLTPPRSFLSALGYIGTLCSLKSSQSNHLCAHVCLSAKREEICYLSPRVKATFNPKKKRPTFFFSFSFCRYI